MPSLMGSMAMRISEMGAREETLGWGGLSRTDFGDGLGM